MKLAQSPHIPQEGHKPQMSDLGWLMRYGIRGLAELVRARLVFNRLEARDIPNRNEASRITAVQGKDADPASLARIAYVIPRLSDRLPWRSDCLIQAIAAQNWLSTMNLASEIRIGVENPKDGPFGAHAWLVHNEQVITGGEIDRYDLLLAGSSSDGQEGRSNADS